MGQLALMITKRQKATLFRERKQLFIMIGVFIIT